MARMVAMVAMVAVGRAGASYWWMGQNAFGDGSESNGLAQAVEGEVEGVEGVVEEVWVDDDQLSFLGIFSLFHCFVVSQKVIYLFAGV